MIDGHVHLENGDLSVDYAMQFVDAAVKKGSERFRSLTIRIDSWNSPYVCGRPQRFNAAGLTGMKEKTRTTSRRIIT